MESKIAELKFRPQKNCFITIPRHWKPHYGQAAVRIWKLQREDCSKSVFVSSSGENINEDGIVHINGTYASKLSLIESSRIILSPVHNVAKALKVIIKPVTSDDWSLIERHSERVEATMLHQVRVVWKGQIAPLWITPGVCVFFKVIGLYPPGECATLDSSTELHVEPNLKDELDNDMEELTETHKISYTSEIIKKLYSFGLSLIGKKEQTEEEREVVEKKLEEKEKIKKPPNINTCIRVEKFPSTNLSENLSNYKLLPEAVYGLVEDFPGLPDIVRCSILKVPSPKALIAAQDRKIEEKPIDVHLILLDYNKSFVHRNIKVTVPNTRSNSLIVHENIMEQLDLEDGDRIKITKSTTNLMPCDKLHLNPCNALPEKFSSMMLETAFRNWLKQSTNIEFPLMLNSSNDFETICSIPTSSEGYLQVAVRVETNKKDTTSCYAVYHGRNFTVETDLNIVKKKKEASDEKLVKLLSDLRGLSEEDNKLALQTLNMIEEIGGSSLLITGPRGSGKTTYAQAIFGELKKNIGLYVEWVDCKPLRGKRHDVVQKYIKNALNQGIYKRPTLIVLDDLDAICGTPDEIEASGVDAQNSTRIAESFRSIIKMCRLENLPIAFLATAASKMSLNNALTRGKGFHVFQTTILIRPLTVDIRKNYLGSSFIGANLSSEFLEELSKNTEGYVAQDFENIKSICNHMKVSKKIKYINEDILKEATDKYIPIGFRRVSFTSLQGNVKWEDIGGLAEVKEDLLKILYWPSKYPELMKEINRPARAGILLYGAPGTGKTHLVGAVAEKTGLRLIVVKGPELLNKYIGASEAAVRDVFQRAASAKPSLLFFDELEALAPRRGHDSTGVTDRVVNQLLTELDGVEGRDGVFVLGATSRPDLIDPALLRPGRFDKKLHCPLPSAHERQEILEILSRNCSLNLGKDVDLSSISEKCRYFSSADLRALLCSTQLYAFKRLTLSLSNMNGSMPSKKESLWEINSLEDGIVRDFNVEEKLKDSENLQVTVYSEDFDRVLAEQKPSVDESERLRYEAIHAAMTSRSTSSISGQPRATLA
ncbi:DgyrCDS6592 [Dimorphilus gyrociliatus]|uniref:Peroxisomal ATPase PEX1 n=1 Tax=Dimorphilus gyrociliatus TaxID=2664684 RepID=A0A7I8VQT1_9ANNE|nr:DgyrCDS6592 [Dimorphilus gyrociliatus]